MDVTSFFRHNFKLTEKNWIILILTISTVVVLYCQFPLLINKYAINRDVRQSNYMYYKFQDKDLFKDDVITDTYFAFNPVGMNAFYFITCFFFNPITVTKFLPIFLCALSVFYMFKLGNAVKSPETGFLASIMFVLICWSREIFQVFGTGTGADFAILFMIMFLYYSLIKRIIPTLIMLVLLALFYSPLLLVCLSTYLISILFDWSIGFKLKKNTMFLIGIMIITVILITFQKYGDARLEITSLIEMKKMAEFYPGGRRPIFSPSVYQQLINPESGVPLDYSLILLLVISTVLFLYLRKRIFCLPRLFFNFILASGILFVVSNIFIYKLCGPSRYMGRYPLPIFLIIFIAANMDVMWKQIKPSLSRNILFLIIMFLLFFGLVPKIKRYYSIAPFPKLYSFIELLPKDALIAGHPILMDDVPTFSKRKAFITEETSEPEFKKLYPIIKQRSYDFFSAYYSADLEKIYKFCKKYGISHLVVNKLHFSKKYIDEKEYYFNPFNAYIKNLINTNIRFALEDIADNKKLFMDGDVFVINTEAILSIKQHNLN